LFYSSYVACSTHRGLIKEVRYSSARNAVLSQLMLCPLVRNSLTSLYYQQTGDEQVLNAVLELMARSLKRITLYLLDGSNVSISLMEKLIDRSETLTHLQLHNAPLSPQALRLAFMKGTNLQQLVLSAVQPPIPMCACDDLRAAQLHELELAGVVISDALLRQLCGQLLQLRKLNVGALADLHAREIDSIALAHPTLQEVQLYGSGLFVYSPVNGIVHTAVDMMQNGSPRISLSFPDSSTRTTELKFFASSAVFPLLNVAIAQSTITGRTSYFLNLHDEHFFSLELLGIHMISIRACYWDKLFFEGHLHGSYSLPFMRGSVYATRSSGEVTGKVNLSYVCLFLLLIQLAANRKQI